METLFRLINFSCVVLKVAFELSLADDKFTKLLLCVLRCPARGLSFRERLNSDGIKEDVPSMGVSFEIVLLILRILSCDIR